MIPSTYARPGPIESVLPGPSNVILNPLGVIAGTTQRPGLLNDVEPASGTRASPVTSQAAIWSARIVSQFGVCVTGSLASLSAAVRVSISSSGWQRYRRGVTDPRGTKLNLTQPFCCWSTVIGSVKIDSLAIGSLT